MSGFVAYSSRAELYEQVARQIAEPLRARLNTAPSATLAVAGGTSPGPIFDILGTLPLDWDRVHVLPTDERWVPSSHPRSNAGLIAARLLQGHAAEAHFVSLYADGNPRERVPELGKTLEPVLPITALLLGMGADMHTASLFPGAPGLAAALAPSAPPLCILEPAEQPELRVSLSADTLNGASSKHLVIFGPDKRAAFERAQHFSVEAAPIRAVMDGLTTHWTDAN